MALAGAFSLGLAGLVQGLWAGPLNPPTGAIVSTGKTLAEVEPRIAINATNTPGSIDSVYAIFQPGSYYLTGNVMGQTGKHGIVIAADNVTLDLNGFSILGGSNTLKGVYLAQPGANGVTVRNGTIRGWGDVGLDLVSSGGSICTVTQVVVRNCAGAGITLGPSCLLSDCTTTFNGGIGLATGSGCTINNCVSSNNSLDGFLLGSGTTMTGCTAYLNTGNGVQTNSGCTVTACTIYANTLDGIRVGTGCVVSNNTFMNNGFGAGNGANIHLISSANRIDGNNCVGADRGIDVDSTSNVIVRNTCRANTVNWDVAANNVIGPVLDRTAPAHAGFTGNANAGSTGTTDPNANFTY